MRHLRLVRRRTTLVLTSAAVCAVALAGCSGSSSGGSTSGGASTPSGSSSSAGTAVNAAALVNGASHSSSKLKSAHITTTSVLGGKTTSFTGVIAYHPTRLDFRIGVAGKELREVLVNNVMYIKVPGGTGAGSKPWIGVGIKQISQLSGIDLDSLLNNANADQTVQLLAKSSDVKFVGNETVGGVSTRHLSGTVDVDKVFAALNATEKSSQKTLQSMVDQLGVKDSHIDLWVNSDDIPVKVVQTYTSKLGAGSSTMLLTGLNAPVTIKAPPASQVQRMAG
jgi:hypothetical protein